MVEFSDLPKICSLGSLARGISAPRKADPFPGTMLSATESALAVAVTDRVGLQALIPLRCRYGE